MTEMGIYDTMSTLRAVRKLKPDPIPEDVLQRVYQAACWAPTGGNTQAWRVIAVKDTALKTRIGELYKAQWEPFAVNYRKRGYEQGEGAGIKMGRTIDAGDYLCDHLYEAPVVLIQCFHPGLLAITDKDQDRPSIVGGGSIYTAIQNLMLACRAEGLGCVLTTLLCQVEPDVKELLNIPYPWATAAMVPIGYPVGKGHGPISRKPVEELFYGDTWKEPLS
jgi:nitroreductase